MGVIEDFLLDLGVDPSHVGFDYIVDAVEIMLHSHRVKLMELYREIAVDYATEWYCVERSIRYAITSTLDHYGAEHMGELLGQMPDINGAYTNARFLALIARQIMPR